MKLCSQAGSCDCILQVCAANKEENEKRIKVTPLGIEFGASRSRGNPSALHIVQHGQRGCSKSYPLLVLVLAHELSDDVTDGSQQAT